MNLRLERGYIYCSHSFWAFSVKFSVCLVKRGKQGKRERGCCSFQFGLSGLCWRKMERVFLTIFWGKRKLGSFFFFLNFLVPFLSFVKSVLPWKKVMKASENPHVTESLRHFHGTKMKKEKMEKHGKGCIVCWQISNFQIREPINLLVLYVCGVYSLCVIKSLFLANIILFWNELKHNE